MEPSRWQSPPIFAPKTTGHGNSPDRPADATSGAGEGTDRKLKKRLWTPQRVALATAAVLFVAFVGYGFSTTTGGSRFNVEREKITIASVEQAPFQELINVTGSIMPRTTVYLDAIEGGRIEEIFIREGALVTAGDPILRLSNTNLQMSLLNSETQLTEQENLVQNMRFQIEQNSLNLRQQLLQMDYDITRLQREFERNRDLYERGLFAAQEYEQIRDELEYRLNLRELTEQSYRQDSLSQSRRIEQMGLSIASMRQNFALVQQSLENLTFRAPVSGHLTALDAELGQLRGSGSRFGQIDVLDGGYKVRAGVDEFYISRVQRGQTARTTEIGGREYRMEIVRVYPEVREGRFEVDMDFIGDVPEGIRRGQTIRFYLELSDPAEAVILPRGGFYQTTGGNWVYVVDPSGDFAVKRNIRIGRQNPNYYEIQEGLEPGEQVITSSYETFGDADRLILN